LQRLRIDLVLIALNEPDDLLLIFLDKLGVGIVRAILNFTRNLCLWNQPFQFFLVEPQELLVEENLF